MAHELIMPEPQKVLAKLDECMENISLVKSSVSTVADIGKLGLAIGGLNQTFDRIHTLEPELDNVRKVFEEVKNDIQFHVKQFEEQNADIGFE